MKDIRSKLAYDLTMWVLGAITALAIVAIFVAARIEDGNVLLDTIKLLLTALLPVMGSWVGTVLAYYYSKDAFETATRLSREPQAADGMPAASIMLRLQRSLHIALAPGQTLDDLTAGAIDDAFAELLDGKPVQRRPVIAVGGTVVAIIHQSSWNAVKAASSERPSPDATLGTLGGYLDETGRREFAKFRGTLAFAPIGATLAEARVAMERVADCLDLFLTVGGKPDEPAIGWITNSDLLKTLQIR